MKQNHMRGSGSGAHLGRMEVRGKKGWGGCVIAFEMAALHKQARLQERGIEGRRGFQLLNYVPKYTFASKL